MDYITIILTSLGSIIVLFFLSKLMGNREISQLSMFDYIASITIGSIAAEMATNLEEWTKPLIAMVIYGLITFAISYLTCKSINLRRFFEGQSLLLYQDGKIYEKNLLKAKLDIDELLEMCRVSGYFDLEEVHTVLLEANGKISVLPMSKYRPATPYDFNLNPTQNYPMANVIIDGKIMKDNLKSTGKDEVWLTKQLAMLGINEIKDLNLVTYDFTNDKVNPYIKLHKEMLRDIFE